MCCDVDIEPALQPLLECELLHFAMANREDGVCLDVIVSNLIGSMCSLMLGCLTCLRSPIFIPHCSGTMSHMSKRNVRHIMNMSGSGESTFSPLVFSATGGMGPKIATVFRSLLPCWLRSGMLLFVLASMYNRLCFSLLRHAVVCLLGHQSSSQHPIPSNVDLRVPLTLAPLSNLFSSWYILSQLSSA